MLYPVLDLFDTDQRKMGKYLKKHSKALPSPGSELNGEYSNFRFGFSLSHAGSQRLSD